MNRSWTARHEMFSQMPARSFAIFCLAVAFTFAAIGVVNDLLQLEHSDLPHLLLKILSTSGFGVLWVVFAYRRTSRLLIVLIIAETICLVLAARLSVPLNRTLTPPEWRTQVAIHGFLIFVFVLFSYGWFGTFFRIEGKRYYAAHAEIELASRIQQQLVPPIEMERDGLEVLGLSVPSGTVGGDLVDALQVDGLVCAYAADIAGHGVAAGVMMSMVKTAVRMHLTTSSSPGEKLLEAVNHALSPLTEPASYATFAYVLIGPNTQVTYSTAGHPPLVQVRQKTGAILRHAVENLPVAMFPETSYQTATIDLQAGDILAIVTDGLTEIFDSKDRELGDSYISGVLTRLSSRPLREMADEIFKTARSFGKITDDQSLLLLRRKEQV